MGARSDLTEVGPGGFRFVPAGRHGIRSPGPWDDEYFMVRVLSRWRPTLAGAFRYAPAFQRLPE